MPVYVEGNQRSRAVVILSEAKNLRLFLSVRPAGENQRCFASLNMTERETDDRCALLAR
jgi:hypothetical protein